MEKINELPEGWKWVKLGEAVHILDNLRKPINSSERQNRIDGKAIKDLIPYYGATGQVGWIDTYITDGDYVLIGEDGAPFLDNFKRKAYKITGKTWVNNHAHVLKEKDKITLNNFVENYLNSINYREYVNGTTRLKLTKGSLVEIPFPLPPLSTQHLIVAKIEELFSELDKGIENLKIAQQQLKIYRQSVLKWAFEGKLTNANVKEGELLKGWIAVRLGDIANSIDPQPSHRTPPIIQGGIPYVSIKDFDSELDIIDFSNARRVSENILAEHVNRYTLEIGDFVIGKIGTIGKPVRIVLPQNYTLSANIVLIQPRKINPTFLYYYFQSSNIEKAFTAGIKATTQAAFGIQKVRELQVQMPKEDEQRLIVQEIESRLSVADKIEESIIQSLQQAEALRQSILKQAFEGKLVVEKKTEIIKPKNVYFHQVQTLGWIAKTSNRKGISHGEMTIAKYAYLVDKIYGVPTYYDFKRGHLGPYPIEMKKAINKKEYFKIAKTIEVVNEETLFKYNNPFKDQVVSAVEELVTIFGRYEEKERAHKTELLATVCKVVEDIKTTDITLVYQSMREWPIDLKTTSCKNKAEKFTEEETKKCLAFIIARGWDKKLM